MERARGIIALDDEVIQQNSINRPSGQRQNGCPEMMAIRVLMSGGGSARAQHLSPEPRLAEEML